LRAGLLENFVWLLSDNGGLGHGACGFTVKVADHDAKTDATVGQHLVPAVFLGGQLADTALAAAAQFAQLRRRNERAAQQTLSSSGVVPPS
jgi:hypothetical protein